MQRTRIIGLAVLLASGVAVLWPSAKADEPAAKGPRISMEEAKKLKSPVPYSKDSIAKGRTLFMRECTECHGRDGKSLVDVIANATDLTDPKVWLSGTSEGEVFRSIRDGAGDAMPPFLDKYEKPDDIWHLVNFVRSLWPAEARPKLADEKSN